MKLYYFGANFSCIDEVYNAKFDGNLFLYNSSELERFTEIAYNSSKIKKDFRYMVAIRPYAVSPQYLYMMYRTIYNYWGDIAEVNIVSGWQKPEEKPYNYFVGDISDTSNSIKKSEYLIKYLNTLNDFGQSTENPFPSTYVSVTNETILEIAINLKSKMILPYHTYLQYEDKVNKGNVIISFTPVITGDTETDNKIDIGNDHIYGTKQEIVDTLKRLKSDGIHGVLLAGFQEERPAPTDDLIAIVSSYRETT